MPSGVMDHSRTAFGFGPMADDRTPKVAQGERTLGPKSRLRIYPFPPGSRFGALLRLGGSAFRSFLGFGSICRPGCAYLPRVRRSLFGILCPLFGLIRLAGFLGTRGRGGGIRLFPSHIIQEGTLQDEQSKRRPLAYCPLKCRTNSGGSM